MGWRRRNRHGDGVLAVFRRAEGGAVIAEIADDVDPAEIAAMMDQISEYCKLQGWNPGRIANHLSDIQMKRNHPGAKRIA